MIPTADKITRAHVWLMGDKRTLAYAGILLVGKVIITAEVETAATNGRDVFYNPGYVESLTDPELRGLILHEAGHKAFQHIFLWQHLWKQNADKINQAADYVINLGIKDLDPGGRDIKLPEEGLIDEKYRGMDSGQVFALLKDDAKGKPMDSHKWEDAQEMSTEDRQAVAREIDAALRAGTFLAGKQGGNISRDFETMLQPVVDWKEQLRDFVSSVCSGRGESTWAKPSRRWLSQDVYMPSQISENIGATVIGIDTSGSISGEAITRALSELAGIAESVSPERVDLLYWDHKVAGHETYFEGDYHTMIASTKPIGGGGSSSESVFAYIKEFNLKPVVCVVITDLYVSFPSEVPPYPVLWVVVGNKSGTAPWGVTLHID